MSAGTDVVFSGASKGPTLFLSTFNCCLPPVELLGRAFMCGLLSGLLYQYISKLNAKWGYTASRDDNNMGPLADLYSSWFSCALDFEQVKCEVGIHGFERRQRCRVFDQPV
ncbi:hypothetical protein HZH68_010960 [Vespula germanica]|uniref:Uncharacterized protein n=1 Tax=Vespula germanica TaxID=30212 RepID=A0A834JYV2_VESGE|nr:hypothetical protein HZH68_010960 [Vespula germanica]